MTRNERLVFSQAKTTSIILAFSYTFLLYTSNLSAEITTELHFQKGQGHNF